MSDDGRCDGRYVVQSFYSAYAEQRVARPDAGSEAVAQQCPPITGWSDTVVPARVPDPADVREVVACIHGAWAPVEVADVPRFRPVTAPTVPADDGGAAARGTRPGQRHRRAARRLPVALVPVVTLRLRTDGVSSPDVVLQCDTLSGPGDAVRWLALGPRAEAAVRSFTDAQDWLGGAPNN